MVQTPEFIPISSLQSAVSTVLKHQTASFAHGLEFPLPRRLAPLLFFSVEHPIPPSQGSEVTVTATANFDLGFSPRISGAASMTASLSKRHQARNERALQELIKTVPGNDRCAECQARNPGIFLQTNFLLCDGH